MEENKKRDDFFNDFETLFSINDQIPSNYARIYQDDAARVRSILDGIKDNKREQLNEIPVLRNFLQELLERIDYNRNDRYNYEYTYGYHDPNIVNQETDEMIVNISEIEDLMYEITKRLLEDLTIPPNELFGIMTPSEMISVRSMENQLRQIPSDVLKYNIKPFVGKEPVGGKYKKRRTRRKASKSKSKRKRTRHNRKRRH